MTRESMSENAPTGASSDRAAFRFGLAAAVAFVGLVIVALGFLFFGSDDPAAYAEAAVVNLGTTVLLAAVIVWLERELLRKVRSETRQLSEQVAAQVEEVRREGQESSALLGDRISNLDERLTAARDADQAHHEATVAAVRDTVTFESVFNLMESAAAIRAISHWGLEGGKLVVRGGSDLQAPRIQVEYKPATEMWDSHPYRSIDLVYQEDDHNVRSEWTEGMGPVDALRALQRAMVTEGAADAATNIEAAVLFEHLAAGIDEAIRAREHRDSWLSDAGLLEWINDDWAITQWGVEARGFGRLIPANAYPHRTPYEVDPGRFPPRPEFVDEELYEYAKSVGYGHFDTSGEHFGP